MDSSRLHTSLVTLTALAALLGCADATPPGRAAAELSLLDAPGQILVWQASVAGDYGRVDGVDLLLGEAAPLERADFRRDPDGRAPAVRVFTLGGRLITMGERPGGEVVQVRDPATREVLREIPITGVPVIYAEPSPSGRYLLVGDQSHQLAVVDLEEGRADRVDVDGTVRGAWARTVGNEPDRLGVVVFEERGLDAPDGVRLLEWQVGPSREQLSNGPSPFAPAPTASGPWVLGDPHHNLDLGALYPPPGELVDAARHGADFIALDGARYALSARNLEGHVITVIAEPEAGRSAELQGVGGPYAMDPDGGSFAGHRWRGVREPRQDRVVVVQTSDWQRAEAPMSAHRGVTESWFSGGFRLLTRAHGAARTPVVHRIGGDHLAMCLPAQALGEGARVAEDVRSGRLWTLAPAGRLHRLDLRGCARDSFALEGPAREITVSHTDGRVAVSDGHTVTLVETTTGRVAHVVELPGAEAR